MDTSPLPKPPPPPRRPASPLPAPVTTPPDPVEAAASTAPGGPDNEHNRVVSRSGPVFPHSRLIVKRWDDPVLDYLGHDPRSPYVERFWLPVLGPSCLFLLRRLAGELERNPDGFEFEAKNWAAELGLGMKGGKHGPFWRSIERACRFNAAQRNGERLVVRRRLPPLSSRQVARLPEHLQHAHRVWAEEQQQRPRRRTVAVWTGAGGPEAA